MIRIAYVLANSRDGLIGSGRIVGHTSTTFFAEAQLSSKYEFAKVTDE